MMLYDVDPSMPEDANFVVFIFGVLLLCASTD